MNNENSLAQKIVCEIALMIIVGKDNVYDEILTKYGEFGLELAKEYCESILDKKVN